MWQKIINFLFMRPRRFRRLAQKLIKRLGEEATEEVLLLLLKGMSLFFFIDENFQKNLKNFNGRYLFATKDGNVHVSVVYKRNKMRVLRKPLSDVNVRVDFKDYKAILDFLTHPNPDIIDLMLNQKLEFKGNLNYIYKFGYMSRHLLLNLGIEQAA